MSRYIVIGINVGMDQENDELGTNVWQGHSQHLGELKLGTFGMILGKRMKAECQEQSNLHVSA